MPDTIDSRGTHMTVRLLTPHEMKRWPDAEIAFTIHYAEGAVKAHALAKIEDAEEFAATIKLACVDARKKRLWKETVRGSTVFIRCACGKLFRLKSAFVLDDDLDHVCPNCHADVEKGDEVPFDEGWDSGGEALLPEGVVRLGKGIHTYYERFDGKRMDIS